MAEIYKEITRNLLSYITFLSLLLILAIWICVVVKCILESYMEIIVSKRHLNDPIVKYYLDAQKKINTSEDSEDSEDSVDDSKSS